MFGRGEAPNQTGFFATGYVVSPGLVLVKEVYAAVRLHVSHALHLPIAIAV